MGGMDPKKKKIVAGGLASVLLVAMVICVTVSVTEKNNSGGGEGAAPGGGNVATTNKAVQAICSPTDYKQTCEESLAGANTTDPKELIRVAFNAAVAKIGGAIKNSTLLKNAAADSSTKDALTICEYVLETATEDLQRAGDKIAEFDMAQANDYVEDLKVWLSAVINYQETCIDAFENTTGDTAEKMKNLLKTAREMSSNGLAMVSDISSILSSLQLGSMSSSRRLLSGDISKAGYGGDPTDYAPGEDPSWKRRLLSGDISKAGYGGDPTDYAPGEDPSWRRRLLSGDISKAGYGGDPTDYAPGEDPSWKRRLLSGDISKVGYGGDPTDYAPGEDPGWVKRRLLAAPAKPNAVVALDGSGQFKSINAAIATVPKKNTQPFVIFVKAGLYKEHVEIPKKVNNVILIGEGPMKTRITGRKNFAEGVKTFQTATVAVNGEAFTAKDIAFENSAGPEKHQAVALRVSGDKAIFHNVHIDGYQDTLYAHNYRQYYRDCLISGTIDFIFGDALAIFQNCKFVVRKPMNNQACMITAQGRVDPRSIGAIVIQGSDIAAEPAFLSAKPPLEAYLGRPWKQLSRTIIMQSNIGGFISPQGWSPWAGTFALDTLYYGEYQNRGPGSNTAKRVTWKGIQKITPQIADKWTGGKAFAGDIWIRSSGVPYVPTLLK